MRIATINSAADVSPYIQANTFAGGQPDAADSRVPGFGRGRTTAETTPGTTPLTAEQVAQSHDPVLKAAVANASTAMQYLEKHFGWSGIDGRGGVLQLFAHAPRALIDGGPGSMANAFWIDSDPQINLRPGIYIGDGDEYTRPFGNSLDVISHEIGHAVLDRSSRFDDRTRSSLQTQALNESFGDVIGNLVDDTNWTTGEDLLKPGIPLEVGVEAGIVRDSAHPLPLRNGGASMDFSDPHAVAAIPTLAAYRVASAVGRDRMGSIWFDAFVKHMPTGASFSDAAITTVQSAKALFGDTAAQSVTDAWKSVGVLR